VLADDDQPWALLLHDQHLYWTDIADGEILRVPVAGGSVEVLATAQYNPFCVAVDDDSVFWATHGQPGQILRRDRPQ